MKNNNKQTCQSIYIFFHKQEDSRDMSLFW